MSDLTNSYDEDPSGSSRTRKVPGTKLKWRRKNGSQNHRRDSVPSKFNGIHRRRRKKIRL